MSASTWLILAIVFFTLAAASFIAAVIMFFMMDIRGIIGDLTGRKAAKGIENIRTENAYANSRSQRAANRHSNPDRQFSIGTGYLKNNANLSDAHASRRIDKSSQLTRDLGGTPGHVPGGTSELLTKVTINNKTGQLERKPMNTNTHRGGSQRLTQNNVSAKYPAQDEYSQATTVLNGAENEYNQATTVLGGTNEYNQATTVLGDTNEYNQATTVLGGTNEYNQATTVLGGTNEYNQATTVLGGANEYNQATTVLGGANEYDQATTVLAGANAGAMPYVPQYDPSKYASRTQMKPNMPLGFRVIRKISVTHCDEVLS